MRRLSSTTARATSAWKLLCIRWVLWSYSIYRTHKPVGFILKGYLAPYGLQQPVQVLVITAASIAVGAVLYRLVEWPSMQLRDRSVPSLFRPSLGLVR